MTDCEYNGKPNTTEEMKQIIKDPNVKLKSLEVTVPNKDMSQDKVTVLGASVDIVIAWGLPDLSAHGIITSRNADISRISVDLLTSMSEYGRKYFAQGLGVSEDKLVPYTTEMIDEVTKRKEEKDEQS